MNGPYFVRAGLMWRKIETWCDDAERSGSLGEAIKSTLLPGQVIDYLNLVARFDNARDSLDALRAVYSFYMGQELYPSRSRGGEGLFGTFQTSNRVNTSWWDAPAGFCTFSRSYIIIASTSTMKQILLDPATGQLFSHRFQGHCLVATPCAGGIDRRNVSGKTVEHPTNPDDGKDSILRWFEEHANRLHNDYYSVGTVNLDENLLSTSRSHALLKFPSVSDTVNCSRAVTRGVEVLASALFDEEKMIYICSIRMRILTPDDGEEYIPPNQRGFDTCQVMSECWKSTKFTPGGQSIKKEFRRDGVMNGKYYPQLFEGGYNNFNFTHRVNDLNGDENIRKVELLGACDGTFAFQMYIRANGQGYFEGYFQCVPGSKDEPSGEMFNVMIAPFPLKYSRFLY